MTEPRLLKRKDAADYLGVAPCSLDRMVRRGTIPGPVRLDGVVRWDRVELDKMIDGKKAKSRYADPDAALDAALGGR